jgi:hypothetical protein
MRRGCCSHTLLTVFLLVWTTYGQPARCQTQLAARVNDLLAKMTLDEKVGQLNLFDVDKTNLEQAIAAGKVGSVLNAVGAAQILLVQQSPKSVAPSVKASCLLGNRSVMSIATPIIAANAANSVRARAALAWFADTHLAVPLIAMTDGQ